MLNGHKAYDIEDTLVKERLQEFEDNSLVHYGLSHISGGFANAYIFDFDEDYFDVELKFGVKSDCENRVEVEQYKMNRYTLQITD